MNQILSVDMPKQTRKTYKESKKASTESVIKFFGIVLLLFGILMVFIGIFSMIRKNNSSSNQVTVNNDAIDIPQISVIQNGTELEVEITGKSSISKVQYRWNNEEIKEQLGNGEKLNITVKIPEGTNEFKIRAIDSNGKQNQLAETYTSTATPQDNTSNQEELNARLIVKSSKINNITIYCEEEKIIKSLIYYYDDDQPTSTDINNKIAKVEIPVNQGEHKLTVKVIYEDSTEKETAHNVYCPTLEKPKLLEDKSGFIFTAIGYEKHLIEKVTININGEVKTEENINSEKYEKTVQFKDGQNKIIITVENKEGISITKGLTYEKK